MHSTSFASLVQLPTPRSMLIFQIGVSAVFVSMLAQSRLEAPQDPPQTQEDLLATALQPIIAFVVLGSILTRTSSSAFPTFFFFHVYTFHRRVVHPVLFCCPAHQSFDGQGTTGNTPDGCGYSTRRLNLRERDQPLPAKLRLVSVFLPIHSTCTTISGT